MAPTPVTTKIKIHFSVKNSLFRCNNQLTCINLSVSLEFKIEITCISGGVEYLLKIYHIGHF